MIHGTLLKINRDPEMAPEVHITDPASMGVQNSIHQHLVQDLKWEMSPLAKKEFSNELDALRHFDRCIKNPKVKDCMCIALALHSKKTISNEQQVKLIYVDEDDQSVTSVTAANPLWKGVKGVRRNVEGYGFELESSAALQSQLFAMLDSSLGDNKWMQSFQLKDKQQQTLYRWQDKHFPNVNNMSPKEMVSLMKNVLNHARLPWITLHFKDSGNACMFAITRPNGKTLNIESEDGEKDETAWGWLREARQTPYEKIGERNDGYRLRISDMRLEMVIEWAMNAKILLHELAHYITFMQPTPYRLNRGKVPLSYDDYEIIFAGHGALYTSIFARLLIDFHYVNEDDLYTSIEDAGLEYFRLKTIRLKDITDGITQYCEKQK